MPGQNIKNYYFNRFDAKLSEIGNYDITLSSNYDGYDSEVVYSTSLINEDDGNKLPVNIDFNSILSNQKTTLVWNSYYSGNTVLSKNYYNPNNEDLSCKTATTLCDIGLTATDNGLYDSMTGQTLTFTMGLNDSEMFNPHYYDRRFKMHPVTGYTSSPNHRFSGNTGQTVYNIVSKTGDTVGYYNELYGGFYQGFYKLSGYDYEVLPERFNKGWTTEFMLKPRKTNEYTLTSNQNYLNDIYPDNSGTFFFMGTRSENKYYHPASGSPVSDSGYTRVTSSLKECIKTCACSDTGVTNSECITVYPQTATTTTHNTGGCGSYTTTGSTTLQDPDLDLFSNALSFRLSGSPENPKICVKYIKFTGDCVTTGTCENTGLTYSSGYTIVETCSSKGIYDDCNYDLCSSGTPEQWVMISAVFSRYTTLEDCDLLNVGGLGDVRELLYPSEINGASYNIIMPPQTHSGSTKETLQNIIEVNRKWFENYLDRLGNLYIYVNGYRFMTIKDFEEIIPHELNTEKEKQLGVPFNISLGGGTQGLRESLVFSGCSGLTGPYIQDPELIPNQILSGTSLSGLTTDIIMEPTFGGSFMGGISQFRMYSEPLSAPQIQHNFRILKDKFGLYDFWCPNCEDCLISPTPTPSITPSITATPSVTPTITPTPSVSSQDSVTLDMGVEYSEGSLRARYVFTASTELVSETTIAFTNTVYKTDETPITIVTGVTINSGERTGETIVTIANVNYSDVKPYEMTMSDITSQGTQFQTVNKTSKVVYDDKTSPIWGTYTFEPCCEGYNNITVLITSESIQSGGWVYNGAGIIYNNRCYTPRGFGGSNPVGYFYGPDFKLCTDKDCPQCPSVTPSATPSITPSITPTISITPSITPTPSYCHDGLDVTSECCILDAFDCGITPSPSVTPSNTPTPSITPSISPSPSVTPSITPTPSPSCHSGTKYTVMCPSSETANCIANFDDVFGTGCNFSIQPGNTVGICAITGSLTSDTAVIIGDEGECCPVCNI